MRRSASSPDSQLTLAERFSPGTTSGTITLSSMNSPLTLHADFFNAWDPRSLDALMKYCIYAHVFCETVSDKRMPPGMTTTTPGGAAPRNGSSDDEHDHGDSLGDVNDEGHDAARPSRFRGPLDNGSHLGPRDNAETGR